MQESPMSSPLLMRWVSIVDGQGRTHMEGRWSGPAEAPGAPAATSAAA